MRFVTKFLRYLWASPVTCVGLVLVGLGLLTGGKAKLVAGAIEAHGGWLDGLMAGRWPLCCGGLAMTLGHVIIGSNQHSLKTCRDHEHRHIRQFERWGPLLLPLYWFAGWVLWFQGRDPYLENPWEMETDAEDSFSSSLWP